MPVTGVCFCVVTHSFIRIMLTSVESYLGEIYPKESKLNKRHAKYQLIVRFHKLNHLPVRTPIT
jgi:hypothetical protein